jgi:hypothetical protein
MSSTRLNDRVIAGLIGIAMTTVVGFAADIAWREVALVTAASTPPQLRTTLTAGRDTIVVAEAGRPTANDAWACQGD